MTKKTTPPPAGDEQKPADATPTATIAVPADTAPSETIAAPTMPTGEEQKPAEATPTAGNVAPATPADEQKPAGAPPPAEEPMLPPGWLAAGWEDAAEMLADLGLKAGQLPLALYGALEMQLCMSLAGVEAEDEEPVCAFMGAPPVVSVALADYVLERRPSAETLYLKAQEFACPGGQLGVSFADLPPAQRAVFELAIRVLPAVNDALAALLAEADARHPPPKIPLRSQPVAVEDTILEEVAGLDDRMEGR